MPDRSRKKASSRRDLPIPGSPRTVASTWSAATASANATPSDAMRRPRPTNGVVDWRRGPASTETTTAASTGSALPFSVRGVSGRSSARSRNSRIVLAQRRRCPVPLLTAAELPCSRRHPPRPHWRPSPRRRVPRLPRSRHAPPGYLVRGNLRRDGQRRQQLKARSRRPCRVVLVRNRQTEQADGSVALEGCDRATVALDRLARRSRVSTHHCGEHLGGQPLGTTCSDNFTEEGRDEATFGGRRRSRSAACWAEPRVRRQIGSTGRALHVANVERLTDGVEVTSLRR